MSTGFGQADLRVGARDDIGHACVALDRRDRQRALRDDTEAEREQLVDRRLRRGRLAERRQHLTDVAEEHRVGPDDEHAFARQKARCS